MLSCQLRTLMNPWGRLGGGAEAEPGQCPQGRAGEAEMINGAHPSW